MTCSKLLVPAKAGTQSTMDELVFLALDSRLRGNERECSAPVSYDFPYTGTMAPRVTLFSGEARNKIVAATSSTFGQAS